MNDSPLSCWIITEATGEVCSAHCNCMAGLGETCTHVAAVLFYLEAAARIQGNQTSTQRKCEWIMPSFQKNVQYLPVKDMDFTSAKAKKRKLDDAIDTDTATMKIHQDSPQQMSAVTPANVADIDAFYDTLGSCGTKPAMLSLVPKYSSSYVPKRMLGAFPQPLPMLHKPVYMELEYHELLKVCESVTVEVTEEMALAVEKETRLQSNSKLWFKYRAGRVTASRMKAACHTDPANPSQSLVKTICYPELFCFSSKQTAWGCRHEKSARDSYVKKVKEEHTNLTVHDSGLLINPNWPFIGASPDGIVSCACCGKGTLEIKCPYCHRGDSIESAASEDSKFCLQAASDGTLHLIHSHAYYYQVQTQLFVSNLDYCDFCVCTFADGEADLHIERIHKDQPFWDICVTKVNVFTRTCTLPELLGKWYTNSSRNKQGNTMPSNTGTSKPSTATSDCEQQKFCYCGGPEEGTMIACDNEDCSIEWFHTGCLRITTVPKGKWYCPDCRKLPKFKRKRAHTPAGD